MENHAKTVALEGTARTHVERLCSVTPNRRTGSPGNRDSVAYVAAGFREIGFHVETSPFDCLDFVPGESELIGGGNRFEVEISPYSLSCDVDAEIVEVQDVEQLERVECTGKILLLRGKICEEQLMPKQFPFYNPDHHRHIVGLLEEKHPAAIITATGRSPELVGALYPFPLIEDGDFDIPTVFCTDSVGEQLSRTRRKESRKAMNRGEPADQQVRFHLIARGRRIESTAANVIARINPEASRKVEVCAHIDAYGDSPGASDNAAGVASLLILGRVLQTADIAESSSVGVELVAFNGEDNYSAGGEKDYLARYGDELEKIVCAINLDDIGYRDGRTAYSCYECPGSIAQAVEEAFTGHEELIPGEPWYQSDHMVFVQAGRPAVALTSEKMPQLMAEITHTDRDTPNVLDYGKIITAAEGIADLIRRLPMVEKG